MAKKQRNSSSVRLKRATLKTAALLTKLKLELGLMSAEKAVEWAAARSASADDDPPYFLHEMTSLQNPTARELIGLLDDAVAGADELPALRMLLGGLSVPLQKNPRLVKRFSTVLEKISRAYVGILPEDMANMHFFQGRLDRAADGEPLGGDAPLRVAADMLEFLNRLREET